MRVLIIKHTFKRLPCIAYKLLDKMLYEKVLFVKKINYGTMFCEKFKFCSSFSALKLTFYVASVTLLLLVFVMQNETVLDNNEFNEYHKYQNVRKQQYANSNPTHASMFSRVSKYF